MDNGNVRMQQYNKAMIVEAYSRDKITSADIEWVLESLHSKFKPPFSIIFIKSGNYWLTKNAQLRLYLDNELLKVAYVVKKRESKHHALNASETYLQNKEVFICDSIDSAYQALIGDL
jgi:hypothetical protein